jgi:hypothetical protein
MCEVAGVNTLLSDKRCLLNLSSDIAKVIREWNSRKKCASLLGKETRECEDS